MAAHASTTHAPEAKMSDQSQISAAISAATKDRLDRFTERHGLKKNFVVEQALLYFMQARTAMPDEALIPTRFVLDDQAFDRIATLLETPAVPPAALRELMRGQGG
jgi:uncharacterized protein (DUF1778 family)